MIDSITIENLRGINSGHLEGLAPLTVLTGPNGSGKSTVLDALLIASSPAPEDAVGRAVKRHPGTQGGSRWLFGALGLEARLAVTTVEGGKWERRLEWIEHCDERFEEELMTRRAMPPFTMILLEEDRYHDDAALTQTGFARGNEFVGKRSGGSGRSKVPFVRLVDPGLPMPLHRTFTEIMKAGYRDDVYALLADLVPDFEQLQILVEDGDIPALYISSGGRSVPVSLSGDGIQAFIQVALEVAIAPGGLVLIEEPEVYQHPKAIWQTAKALMANQRRGVQTVLTTHSLELIDALVAEASEEDLERMALFNLRLDGREMVSSRRAGREMAFARQELEKDLR